jgi:hypothetical protein
MPQNPVAASLRPSQPMNQYIAVIYIAVNELLNTGHGWTYEVIHRHEIGHCNGWPGSHAGARVRSKMKKVLNQNRSSPGSAGEAAEV